MNILAKTPTVQVEGPPVNDSFPHKDGITTYKLRRLTVNDLPAFSKIVNIGLHYSEFDIKQVNLAELRSGAGLLITFSKVLSAVLDYAKDELYDLLGNLLRVDPKYFSELKVLEDGEEVAYFPIWEVSNIAEALINHPDLVKFFEQLGKRMGALAKAPASPEVSTESKPDTAG